MGEYVSHGNAHNMSDAENDDDDDDDDDDDADKSSANSDEDGATAVAEDDDAAVEEDDDTAVADGHDMTAVAADDVSEVAVDESSNEIVLLRSSQADKVHQSQVAIAALQSTIECLKRIGQLRMLQCVEAEISKLRSRARSLMRDSPAVAETFRRQRMAEDE